MDKHNLTREFALRLREAMITAGFNSQRSTSGVCIHKLAEITGYSLQICRKYLRGEAMPEPSKIIEIAETLKVSPSWLLFGENHYGPRVAKDTIYISKELLQYVFASANALYKSDNTNQEISNFLMELINDVSLINADIEQSKKIINLALSSAKHFTHPR